MFRPEDHPCKDPDDFRLTTRMLSGEPTCTPEEILKMRRLFSPHQIEYLISEDEQRQIRARITQERDAYCQLWKRRTQRTWRLWPCTCLICRDPLPRGEERVLICPNICPAADDWTIEKFVQLEIIAQEHKLLWPSDDLPEAAQPRRAA